MKPKVVETEVAIPAIETQRVTITLIGISPLVMNRFSPTAIKAIRDKQTGEATNKRGKKKPDQLYEESIYRKEDGSLTFPASALKAVALGGVRHVEGLTIIASPGLFFIDEDSIVVEGKPEKFEAVVRNETGVCDLRYRAKFHEWSLTFSVDFDPNAITLAQLLHLYVQGGHRVGIGDGRPASKKNHNFAFGRFKVAGAEEFKEKKLKAAE